MVCLSVFRLFLRDFKGLQSQKILDVLVVFPWFLEQTEEKKEIKQLLQYGARQARPYIVVGRFYSVGTEMNEIFAALEDYPGMYSMDIVRTQVSLAKLFAGADLSALLGKCQQPRPSFPLVFLFPWCFSCCEIPWSFWVFSAYFPWERKIHHVM